MKSDQNLADRLRFHGIDTQVSSELLKNKEFIMKSLPQALDAFYRHVAAFPEVARFFRSADHMAHAKAMQLRHWDLITSGRFDETYVASVTKIGEVHNAIGLEPKLYIGGYNFLLSHMMGLIASGMTGGLFKGASSTRAVRLQTAVAKALMLDMDLAIAVYIEAGRRQAQATLQGFADRLDQSVGAIVSSLATSAGQMQSAARDLSATAKEASQQSDAVAAAAEEASASVRSVAAATEEMAASAHEIGRQVTESANIASQAVAVANDTVQKINRLSDSADKIGTIVDLIRDIAGQTNLLALNATIEAARAGEAGRGFAVVAAEVKGLADQTAKATAEIGSQIGGIQTETKETAQAINMISDVIRNISAIAASISSAVQQQGAATNEIAENVEQASRGTQAVTANIFGVHKTASSTLSASDHVLTSSNHLGEQSDLLHSTVQTFLKTIKAG